MRAVAELLLPIAILAGWLALAPYGVAQSATASSVRMRSALEQAQQALRAGDLPHAREALQRALAIDRHSLVALNELGIVLARGQASRGNSHLPAGFRVAARMAGGWSKLKFRSELPHGAAERPNRTE